MEKNEVQNIIKIPPMEYFKLDRAANILQCDIEDLLHFGVIGAIPLCVMMRGFSSALIFMSGQDIQDPIDFYHEHEGLSSFLFRESNYISYFNSSLTEYDVYKTDSGFVFFKGIAHGLWCLGHGEIESLIYTRQARVIDTTIFRPFGWDAFREKTGLSCHIVSDIYFNQSWLPSLNRTLAESPGFQLSQRRKPELNETLTISDLFIARDTILKIKDAINKGEPMKSMINGGVINNEIPDRLNIDKAHGNTQRWSENRENSIMALIFTKNQYPDECKNNNGAETQDAWAAAAINHWGFVGGGYDEPGADHLKKIISDMSREPSERKTAGKPKQK